MAFSNDWVKWLIETRVVFEFWKVYTITSKRSGLIETRVVFEYYIEIQYLRSFLRLIETRVVFELRTFGIQIYWIPRLIETRVVFESAPGVFKKRYNARINRNKSCIWIINAIKKT